MKSIFNWCIQKIKDFAKRSWENNKIVHKKALKKSEGRWCLFIALLVLIIFSWVLIPDAPSLGLSFLFAGSMAIYAGYIYKGEHVMGYVLAGVILATIIPSLLPSISDSYKNADYIGMIILLFLGILIWYYSSRLKKGEIPTLDDKPMKNNKSGIRRLK